MNWRIVAGLLLLLFGMMGLYQVMGNAAGAKPGGSSNYIQAACIIWMAAGVLLIVRGTRAKDK